MNVKDEITMMPYVIDDLWITEASGQERYWLCSKKIAIFVPDWVPLWHAIQNNSLTLQSQVVNTNENLQAQINSPYLSFPPASLLDFLEYEIWVVKDDRQSFSSFYQTTAKNLLKTPLGTIDPLLIEKPIWTTWARYFRTINESYLLEFADEIVSNGFPIAQLELDDSWTTHYGDYQVYRGLSSLYPSCLSEEDEYRLNRCDSNPSIDIQRDQETIRAKA
uniref:Uncharacterized protein n=1 Tax=Acrobeloides nanus TaxID=290746 RepID=A0A914DER6_9BILA